MMKILLTLCSARRRKLGEGWPLSSYAEFEVKFEKKFFALSVEEGMTSETFLIVGTAALLLFVIWLLIFKKS